MKNIDDAVLNDDELDMVTGGSILDKIFETIEWIEDTPIVRPFVIKY